MISIPDAHRMIDIWYKLTTTLLNNTKIINKANKSCTPYGVYII